MKDPAYFIMARIDLTGSSSSYHRPAVIRSAINHLDEWWFAGTDYTRHWMPYGVSWSEDHCDITNHYLGQGIKGGLLLMFLFIGVIWLGFRCVGNVLRRRAKTSNDEGFFVWAVGAALFAHAGTCIAVAYFDQSVLFMYLVLAICASLWATESVRSSYKTVYPIGEIAPQDLFLSPQTISIESNVNLVSPTPNLGSDGSPCAKVT